MEETEGKRQRGRDRGNRQRGTDREEERGETEGKRQRGRERGRDTERRVVGE